jgi:hypothetical protein
MPGYGGSMEQYAPTPVEEVKTVEKRFVMPTLTLVQLILVGTIVVYAWKARKMKGAVVGSIALAIGLLHVYDHMYRVKRGPEHLFFLPRGEGYRPRKGRRGRRGNAPAPQENIANDAIKNAQDHINEQMKAAMKGYPL